MKISSDRVLIRVDIDVYASISSHAVPHGDKFEYVKEFYRDKCWSRINKIFSNDN